MKHKLLKALAIMIVGIIVMIGAALIFVTFLASPAAFVTSVAVMAFCIAFFWAVTYLHDN